MSAAQLLDRWLAVRDSPYPAGDNDALARRSDASTRLRGLVAQALRQGGPLSHGGRTYYLESPLSPRELPRIRSHPDARPAGELELEGPEWEAN